MVVRFGGLLAVGPEDSRLPPPLLNNLLYSHESLIFDGYNSLIPLADISVTGRRRDSPGGTFLFSVPAPPTPSGGSVGFFIAQGFPYKEIIGPP
jgi:hypothetical protein